MNWSIEYYERADGKQPMDNFLDSLARNHKKLYAFIMALVNTLRIQGHRLEPQFMAPCNGYAGLWDLFANDEGFTAHLFFGFSGSRIVLLDGHLHSNGSKHGVPKSSYERAFGYWKNFQAGL